MNLLFDLAATQPNTSGKRHGGGKYGEVIFKRIVDRKLNVYCIYDSRKWFNPHIMEIIEKNQIILFDISKNDLETIVKKENISIYYSPLPGDNSISQYCKVIRTIHGLRGLELHYDRYMSYYRSTHTKKLFSFNLKRFFPKIGYKPALKKVNSLLSWPNFNFVMVSNHSKNSLLSYCPNFKDKNIPVYYSPSTDYEEIIDKKYNEDYYLLVSANRWEKNNLRAIIALDRLFANGFLQNKKVKITGVSSPKAFKYNFKNIDRFDFLGYVEDEELNQLYHDAYSLIYPSLNEGFGYPPLEAMRYGTPVIASPFTSIPEVCGGAVIYTNPLSIEEIMNRIIQMDDIAIRNKYSALAIEQYDKIHKKQIEDLDKLIDYIYK